MRLVYDLIGPEFREPIPILSSPFIFLHPGPRRKGHNWHSSTDWSLDRNGDRERARRVRQIARGSLTESSGLVRD